MILKHRNGAHLIDKILKLLAAVAKHRCVERFAAHDGTRNNIFDSAVDWHQCLLAVVSRLGFRIIAPNTLIGLTGIVAFSNSAQAENECGIAVPGSTITCNSGTFTPSGAGGVYYSNIDGLSLTADGLSLVATGSGRQGIRLRSTNAANTGDLNLSFESGDVVTGSSGTIGTSSSVSTGRYGDGLRAENRGTGATILTFRSGSIVTYGYNAMGLYAWQRTANPGNHSDVAVNMLSGDIDTYGIFSHGVFGRTDTGLGDVFVSVIGGNVTTHSTGSSYGVYGLVRNGVAGADGNVSLTVEHAQIETNGGSSALAAINQTALGNASMAIGDGADIRTRGDGAHGAYANLSHADAEGGISIVMSGGSITTNGANSDGILARINRTTALGAGTYGVNLTAGTITSGSGTGAGIRTVGPNGGNITIGASATIDGSASGVAIRDGDLDRDGVDEYGGNTVVTTLGTVTGNTILGLGNDTFNLVGGVYDGDIYGDDQSASGNDGDDTFNWTGGNWLSSFFGTNGSDVANVSANSYDGTHHVLDGGDDVSAADGWVDVLTFSGINAAVNGSNLLNWETVNVVGGRIELLNGQLTVGADQDTGLFVTNGGTFDAGDAVALTGNVATESGGGFLGTGAGEGRYLISGSLTNKGYVSTQDGKPGDQVVVRGDYLGGGTISLDIALDASERPDQLTIEGVVVGGGTTVTLSDIGAGLVSPTGHGAGDGIKLIDVSNTGATAEGDFILNGELDAGAISGPYVYNLFLRSDGNWYLQNVYVPSSKTGPAIPLLAPTVPVYEVYPQILMQMTSLPTLQQRFVNRSWQNIPGSAQSQCVELEDEGLPCDLRSFDAISAPKQLARRSGWARVIGARTNVASSQSTARASYKLDRWQTEGGLDFLSFDTPSGGRVLAGLTLHYGHGDTDVNSLHGTGGIRVEGKGIGVTSTYYMTNGIYLDGQARWTRYVSDLSAEQVGVVADEENGTGFAFGLEVGMRTAIDRRLSLTPQAQISYSRVDFDTLVDPFEVSVSRIDGDSLKTRLGVSLNYNKTTRGQDGSVNQLQLYGIANLNYEFQSGTEVSVNSLRASHEFEALEGELGVGGTTSWADGRFSAHAEVTGSTSFSDFSDRYTATGRGSFRVRF